MRERACSIVIHRNKLLFVEQMVNGQLRHVFIGGGIEEGETPQEAAFRELAEEANVKGKIVFGPAIVMTGMIEYVFIMDILENAKPFLGYDPEHPSDKQEIKNLIWLDVNEDIEKFNSFDTAYFLAIVNEGKKQGVVEEWINILERIIAHNAIL